MKDITKQKAKKALTIFEAWKLPTNDKQQSPKRQVKAISIDKDIDTEKDHDLWDPFHRNKKDPPHHLDDRLMEYLKKGRYMKVLCEYPLDRGKRRFSKDIFQKYKWIEWSRANNTMHCFPCYIMKSELVGWTVNGTAKYDKKLLLTSTRKMTNIYKQLKLANDYLVMNLSL